MDWHTLSCGFFEGLTTFGMLSAYLYRGGDATSFIFWIYVAQFLASFAFHIFPNQWTRFLDMSMINLMIMERGYLKTQNVWIYYFCLASMLFDPIPPEIMVMARVAVVCAQGQTTFVYMYFWAIVAVFFIESCKFQEQGDRLWTMLTCVLYHIYLAAISALEVPMYVQEITNTTDGFLRYCAYFLFVSYVMTRITNNPKRLRSILSFMTALVLSPLSFYEIFRQIQYGGRVGLFHGDTQIHYFMTHFYLAYVVVDILVGMIYYPEYFTFLEGWLHHVGTFSFVYFTYYHNPDKIMLTSIYLIVETSSIILFLSRIFYDVPWIQNIKKIFFYPIFVVFRIIIPTFLIFYLYRLCDGPSYFIYGSSTLLYIYWLMKMWCW